MKRVADVLGAALALILALPALAIGAALVRVAIGRPIIFRQTRPGLRGEPFTVFKLRTMIGRESDVTTSENDALRLSSIGRMLRRLSVDELPQLWNVLLGDMSLVGPRPLLMQYLARYTPRQAMRHLVRPGITGLAQVNGRNALSWEERFELDLYYVSHVSWQLDLWILWRTVATVLRRRGISQDGHVSSSEFRGSSGS